MEENIRSHQEIKRIGILLIGFQKANIPALQFLVLHMNSLQHAFEFEFLPIDPNEEVVKQLSTSKSVNREKIRGNIPAFIERYNNFLQKKITGYKLTEATADYFILVTKTCFSDNYYIMRKNCVSVIALGNWKRSMAPPSILEFILTLIIREAVASVSKSLRGSIHLGTKGCLFDFTASLSDVRNKVLNGFICGHCCEALKSDGFSDFPDELTPIIRKQWLGKSDEPNSPAGISLKLGYDLFATKGAEATIWEKFLAAIQDEGIKQLIKIAGAVIIAGLLFWLGLK
jgi:hypothetical protein